MIQSFLAALILIFCGCNHPAENNVPGIYYARHGQGTEYIELKRDHTFIQYFQNDSINDTVTGTWRIGYYKPQKKWKLVLRELKCFAPDPETDPEFVNGYAVCFCDWNDSTIIKEHKFTEFNYYRKPD
jgi:hypothetical protein